MLIAFMLRVMLASMLRWTRLWILPGGCLALLGVAPLGAQEVRPYRVEGQAIEQPLAASGPDRLRPEQILSEAAEMDSLRI